MQQKSQKRFWSVLSCSKEHYFVPIACQCMLANCGANTHRPVWSAYVLHITMPIDLCIAYPEMLVFAHTRPTIVTGHLMPCWETVCIDFLYDAHLHPIFLFFRFKYLMLSTNLHFSSIMQRSCMIENKCSSWWIVSVFASNQHCFCVVKRKNVCAMYTNQAYKK